MMEFDNVKGDFSPKKNCCSSMPFQQTECRSAAALNMKLQAISFTKRNLNHCYLFINAFIFHTALHYE